MMRFVIVALLAFTTVYGLAPVAAAPLEATSLTEAQARQLVDTHMGEPLDLPKITALGTKPNGNNDPLLELKIAGVLAKHDHELYLGGLTTLSKNAAERLAKHRGPLLVLNGLIALGDPTADALAKHKGELALTGLQSLTNVNLARKLASQNPERFLNLDGLKTVAPAAADELADHNGKGIRLGHLTELLSRKLAKKMAAQQDIILNGLRSITPEVAAELASGKGFLSLNGIEQLDDKAAAELARHGGDLCLGGLLIIPNQQIARKLGQNPKVQPNAARIEFYRLQTLKPDVARELVAGGRPLSFPAVTTLTVEAAQALATSRGKLELDNLEHLSEDVAKALADYCGPRLELMVRKPLSCKTQELLSQNPNVFVRQPDDHEPQGPAK